MTNSALNHRRVSRPVIAAGAAFILASCSSVTPINQLLANPAKYEGKTVSVEGQVQQSVGGLGIGAYELKDATGTLTVVSDKNAPPPSGVAVTVKGIFQSLFTIGVKSLAVLREQSRSSS